MAIGILCPQLAAPLVATPAYATSDIAAQDARMLEVCRRYEAERAELAKTDIQNDMAQGAAWAKENLSANRLKAVLRFIFLDEQVRFRCADAFALASVRKAEEAAKVAAARVVARQRAAAARRAEQFRNIPNPKRKPRFLRRRAAIQAAARNRRRIPLLPPRRTR
ncbi:MAG: hypothetical protein AAGG72_02190 [Pseudomonadota bacterium]